MRLTLDALETLDAIAEQGSFARAAAVLHRVPSALTYTVHKLESDLSVKLFDRTGKRAVLTPAGLELLEKGRELLRQAEEIETRIKRVGQGWETQLTLAVDEIVPLHLLFPAIREFDLINGGTRLRFTQEILGGTWDALLDRRADLAIGAPGDPPNGEGCSSRELGSARFIFACAPQHPLAQQRKPISMAELTLHRAVVVADSSRRLAARTAGVQPGQEVLVVPTLEAKINAQAAGLGVGFVPEHLAKPWISSGKLVRRTVEMPREPVRLNLAWRNSDQGRALSWFRERILADAPLRRLLRMQLAK